MVTRQMKLWCLGVVVSLMTSRAFSEVPAGDIRALEERIKVLEDDRRGLRPERADWLELGGDLRFNLVVPESATVLNYIEIDRLQFNFRATLSNGVYTAGNIQFRHGAGAATATSLVDKWYTRFSLGDHWLRAGLTDRFIEPGEMDLGSRLTAAYPILAAAFYRDEQYNVTAGGLFPTGFGDIRYRLSYGAGLIPGNRRPTEHGAPSFVVGLSTATDIFFADRDHGQRADEFGVGLGYRSHFGKDGTADLVGFGLVSRMTASPSRPTAIHSKDWATFINVIGWPENKQQRIGGRIVLRKASWLLMSEYIDATDGNLNRDAWNAQLSHRFKFNPLIGGRFLTAVEPLVRYGQYIVNTPKTLANPFTWDREQWNFAILCDIVRNVSLRIEYDVNKEITGGQEMANDEFRTQLRTRW